MDNYSAKVYRVRDNNNIHFVDPLTLLCIKSIAANWTELPLLKELKFNNNIYTLLANLSVDLPLEMTIKHIDDDLYWKRCFKNRWKSLVRYPIPEEMIVDYENGTNLNEEATTIDVGKIKNDGSVELGKLQVEFQGEDNEEFEIAENESKMLLESKFKNNLHKLLKAKRNTWKQYYIQRHIEEFLENLRPGSYDHEQNKKIFEICDIYVTIMEINKLQAPYSDATDRIPMDLIFSEFNNVTELSICFKQTDLVDSFSWHALNTTYNDVKNLARGIEQMNLATLRILNSDIDCEKAEIVINALKGNDQLNILDFSHCKISDKGISNLEEYFANPNNLECLYLTNNFFGEKGAKVIANSIKQKYCKLREIDLRLNNIGPNAGNFLAAALIKNNTVIKLLLSGCGLTKENILISKLLRHNTSLKYIILNNNSFGEELGNKLVDGLSYNNHLTTLDVRMCKILLESEFQIKKLLKKNRNWATKLKVANKVSREIVQDNELDIIDLFEKYHEYFKHK